ncbi:MAG: type II toxin-antitoxin system VapC family toxin [Chloroflexota bacterium]|nr:type II toxin-antitoxin system VapC family toxin [Chloroflexota bacterium]
MSKSSAICLDANIIIRVVMRSDDSVQERWHNWIEHGRRLIAPTLLFYEVVNGLYQYRKHDYISESVLIKAVKTALAMPVEIVNDAGIHQRAVSLAVQLSLSATYDAHYLALAERIGAELWTGDRKLVRSAHQSGLDWVNFCKIL